MVTFDDASLRAQVVTDYNALTRGVTDATQMGLIFDIVMKTADSTVRELLQTHNAVNTVNRLPPEILAACFTLLTFKDRIRVSHVCCAWRAAAVAHPDVWSTLTMGFGFSNRFELLKMALPRAGALPLDLSINTIYPTTIKDLDAVLLPHAQQIRRVSWGPEEKSALWTRAAPRLEHIDYSNTLVITPDFLGGREGSLKVMLVGCCAFPRACPALSTVVDLRIRDTGLARDTASFRMLFELLPRLESLYIAGLEWRDADNLPSGPAPASLRDLTLECTPSSGAYDLVGHYLAWGAQQLRTVSLGMRYFPNVVLQPLLDGAAVLWVKHPDGANDTHVMSEHPNSTFRSVHLAPTFDSQPVVHPVQRACGALQSVHTVKITHNALKAFLPVLAELRALKRLVVRVGSTRDRSVVLADNAAPEDSAPRPPPRYILDWAPLSCLARLPHLESLTIQVSRAHFRETPTSLDDAEALLGILTSIDTSALPHIEVQGFREAPMDAHGLRLTFDTTADLKAPSLRIRRPPFYFLRGSEWFF